MWTRRGTRLPGAPPPSSAGPPRWWSTHPVRPPPPWPAPGCAYSPGWTWTSPPGRWTSWSRRYGGGPGTRPPGCAASSWTRHRPARSASARWPGPSTVVLHPGVPTDRLYRRLQLPVCTFEGSWEEYQRWDGAGSFPGDGHLVHSVPAAGLAGAWALLRERAGWGLVTDRCPPAPYAGAPGWLLAPRQDQPDPPSLRPSALR